MGAKHGRSCSRLQTPRHATRRRRSHRRGRGASGHRARAPGAGRCWSPTSFSMDRSPRSRWIAGLGQSVRGGPLRAGRGNSHEGVDQHEWRAVSQAGPSRLIWPRPTWSVPPSSASHSRRGDPLRGRGVPPVRITPGVYNGRSRGRSIDDGCARRCSRPRSPTASRRPGIITSAARPFNTRNVTAFSGGQYWVWQVSGPVRFRATHRAGGNAVVSAVFLDPWPPAIRGVAPTKGGAASGAHRLSAGGFETEAPTFNAPPPIQHQIHRLGICTMLLREDSLRKRFR